MAIQQKTLSQQEGTSSIGTRKKKKRNSFGIPESQFGTSTNTPNTPLQQPQQITAQPRSTGGLAESQFGTGLKKTSTAQVPNIQQRLGSIQPGQDFRFSQLSPQQQAVFKQESALLGKAQEQEDEAKKLQQDIDNLQESGRQRARTQTELQLQELSRTRATTKERFKRQKQGIEGQFAQDRQAPIAGSTLGLQQAGIKGVDTALSQASSQLQRSELNIRQSQEALDQAVARGDMDTAKNASESLQRAVLAGQQARKDVQLFRQQEDERVLDILTGLESPEQANAIAQQMGVDPQKVDLLIQQKKLQALPEQQRAETERRQTSFKNFQSLNNNQVAGLTAEQIQSFSSSMGMDPGTIANWVIGAQEAEKATGEERDLKALQMKQRMALDIQNSELKQQQQGFGQALAQAKFDFDQKKFATGEVPDFFKELSYINGITDPAERMQAFALAGIDPEKVASAQGNLANVSPTTQTALQVGQMDRDKGGFRVVKSLPGTYASTFGAGNIITGSGWTKGLDIDGRRHDPVPVPPNIVGGKVVEVKTGAKNYSPGFGNFVVIEDSQGKQWQFSHLENTTMKEGDVINAGDIVGTIGVSGAVTAGPSGDGSHLDLTVWQPGKERRGAQNAFTAQEVEAMTNGGVTPKTEPVESEAEKLAKAIMDPASSASLRDLTPTKKAQVLPILNSLKQKALESGDTTGIMLASAGGKDPDQSFRNSFEKGATVVSQLGQLSSIMQEKKGEFGPIAGWLAEKNPWNTDAQKVKALLTQTTPNLARGVFGEVGVLTDNDIRLYQQTIPNLRQTSDVRDAVLGLTLRTVRNSLQNKVEIAAGSNMDVSGLVRQYKKVDDKVKKIEKDLGISDDSKNKIRITPQQEAFSGIAGTIAGLPEKERQSDIELFQNFGQPQGVFDQSEQSELDNIFK